MSLDNFFPRATKQALKTFTLEFIRRSYKSLTRFMELFSKLFIKLSMNCLLNFIKLTTKFHFHDDFKSFKTPI